MFNATLIGAIIFSESIFLYSNYDPRSKIRSHTLLAQFQDIKGILFLRGDPVDSLSVRELDFLQFNLFKNLRT